MNRSSSAPAIRRRGPAAIGRNTLRALKFAIAIAIAMAFSFVPAPAIAQATNYPPFYYLAGGPGTTINATGLSGQGTCVLGISNTVSSTISGTITTGIAGYPITFFNANGTSAGTSVTVAASTTSYFFPCTNATSLTISSSSGAFRYALIATPFPWPFGGPVGFCTGGIACAAPVGDTNFTIPITTTITQFIAAPSNPNQSIRITSISSAGWDTATGGAVSIFAGTGTNCATATATVGIINTLPAAAGSSNGVAWGNGFGAVMILPPGDAACVAGGGTISTGRIQGTYTVF